MTASPRQDPDPTAPGATERMFAMVYDELRQLAAARLAREQPGQTLDATALVHEAYVRLQTTSPGEWANRGHFFAAAATAMRRILIERARRRKRIKHGGQRPREPLGDVPEATPSDDLLALDNALTELASEDSLAAQVVEMHHFAGLSHQQVAEALGLTVYQARQKWTYARAWLLAALRP